SDRLLLTCHHVVVGKKGDPVDVCPFGRKSRGGTIRDVRTLAEGDLALVDVDAVDGEGIQPAVVLHPAITDHIEYFAAGYPKEELLGKSGLEVIPCQGHARRPDENTVDLLVIEAGGALVGSGLSGGGVLSSGSGAVAALVQYAQDPKADSGGA